MTLMLLMRMKLLLTVIPLAILHIQTYVETMCNIFHISIIVSTGI